MKIQGKKIEGKRLEVVYIPRGEEGDEGYEFTIGAVMDMERFEKLCPEPKAPMKFVVGQGHVPNLDDSNYQQQMESYGKKRLAYYLLEGLRQTEGLEWEKVKEDDPSTWELYDEELKESGLSQLEINQLIQGMLRVNGLDEEHVKEARKRFLARIREAASNQ
jgi:hypothetical protein